MKNKNFESKIITETKLDNGRIRRRVQLFFNPDEAMTQQHCKDECDIDNILSRYDRLGVDLLELQAQNPGLYGDFSDVGSFQEAQNIIVAANAQFAALSASIRERFGNDPANFLRFMEDPKTNKDEMVKMGLASLIPEKEATIGDLQKTLQERLPLQEQGDKPARQRSTKQQAE